MAGTAGIQNLIVIAANITGDATGGDDYTLTRPGTVIDAWVVCTAANAQGTILIGKGASAITDAMICAVDKVVVHAGTIDDANALFATGDSLRFTANGAADRGLACVLFMAPVADNSALT